MLQSGEELKGEGDSEEETAEEQGEDEEDEKASDTLLQELWKDCGGVREK